MPGLEEGGWAPPPAPAVGHKVLRKCWDMFDEGLEANPLGRFFLPSTSRMDVEPDAQSNFGDLERRIDTMSQAEP